MLNLIKDKMEMKNITKYLLAAVAMTAVVSCAQDIAEDMVPVGKAYVFTATLDADTKAAFDEASMKTIWTPGTDGKEHIAVIDGNNVVDYVAVNLPEGGASMAEFAPAVEGTTLNGPAAFAVYPYSTGLTASTADGLTVNVTYPAVQKALAGTFDPAAPVAVAYNADIAADPTFAFRNASALLKIQVQGETPVTSIEVSALGENPAALAGAAVLTVSDNGVAVAASGETSVKLVSEAAMEAGRNYYIAVAPATLSGGLSVRLNGSDEMLYKVESEVVLERNKVYDLGAFPFVAPPAEGDVETPWGKQFVFAMNSGLGLSMMLIDFGVTQPEVIHLANQVGESEWMSVSSWELADRKVVPANATDGCITWKYVAGEGFMARTTYYKITYTDLNLEEGMVTMMSVDDHTDFVLDETGEKIPVGMDENDDFIYATYTGLGLANSDEEGNPSPVMMQYVLVKQTVTYEEY